MLYLSKYLAYLRGKTPADIPETIQGRVIDGGGGVVKICYPSEIICDRFVKSTYFHI